MPTLVLREPISSSTDASTKAARAPKSRDKSLESVLIFSGIGFGLMVLAIIFRVLELPPPVF